MAERKLTMQQARAIRAELAKPKGERPTIRALAARYSVGATTIMELKNNWNYKESE